LASDWLKALKINFDRDFYAYADNLLAPERRASNPSSSDIINGFSLDNDDSYNEFQSDASAMGVVGKVNCCGQFNTLVHQTFVEELF
jgi:hypothetical protein